MFEEGDLLERKSGNVTLRGVVTSNDRAGLFVLTASGLHLQIPGSNLRKITEADGKEYVDLKRVMDKRLKQFNG